MPKSVLISFCILVVAGFLFMFRGDTMSPDDMRSYTLSKAYLEKNTEQYARCYNSINYGTSGLIDIELALMSEYFNDSRVNSEQMKPVAERFMNDIKRKCEKPINDYESAYNKVEAVQKKSESLAIGWRTFVFGGGQQFIPMSSVMPYSPPSARLTVSFNDYVFTEQEAIDYFKKELSL